MNKQELKKILQKEFKVYLKNLGFSHNLVSKKEIEKGWFVTFGLNIFSSAENDFLEVNPVVGILNKEVEDIIYETYPSLDQKYKYSIPHSSSPVAYLLGDKFFTWTIRNQKDIEIFISEIDGYMKINGPIDKYFKDGHTLDGLINLMEDNVGTSVIINALPIAYYLTDKRDKAIKYLKEMEISQGEGAKYGYSEFAKNLTKLIENK